MKRGPKIKKPRNNPPRKRVRINSSSTMIWRKDADGRLLRAIVGPAIHELAKYTNLVGISQWTEHLEGVASSKVWLAISEIEKSIGIFALRDPGAAENPIVAANTMRMAFYTKPIQFKETEFLQTIPVFDGNGYDGNDPEVLASEADRKRRARLHTAALTFIQNTMKAPDGLKQVTKLQDFCRKFDKPYFEKRLRY